MTGGLAAFLGVAAVVICTPGQDTALTIRNALSGGRRGGVGTAAGVALGQAGWTLATAVGIASLLSASRSAFVALRLAGAVYLVVLGLLTFTWLSLYAVAVSRARRVLLRDPVRRLIDAVTGVVLVAFGVRLATTRG